MLCLKQNIFCIFFQFARHRLRDRRDKRWIRNIAPFSIVCSSLSWRCWCCNMSEVDTGWLCCCDGLGSRRFFIVEYIWISSCVQPFLGLWTPCGTGQIQPFNYPRYGNLLLHFKILLLSVPRII